MTFPAALRPAARSAYRDVLRAARETFHGDLPRRAQLVSAVRATFSTPTLTDPAKPPLQPLEGPPVDFSAPEQIQKRIDEWKEVAAFLRKNVVQGTLDDKSGRYQLRVTEHTELGDNETIKAPEPMPVTPFPNRGKNRRRKKCGE